jgi:hypothetical protein
MSQYLLAQVPESESEVVAYHRYHDLLRTRYQSTVQGMNDLPPSSPNFNIDARGGIWNFVGGDPRGMQQ